MWLSLPSSGTTNFIVDNKVKSPVLCKLLLVLKKKRQERNNNLVCFFLTETAASKSKDTRRAGEALIQHLLRVQL